MLRSTPTSAYPDILTLVVIPTLALHQAMDVSISNQFPDLHCLTLPLALNRMLTLRPQKQGQSHTLHKNHMIIELAEPRDKTKIFERGIRRPASHRSRTLPVPQAARHDPDLHLGIRETEVAEHTLD